MDAFNIVQKLTKESLDRTMTLRCLGIGWPLARRRSRTVGQNLTTV